MKRLIAIAVLAASAGCGHKEKPVSADSTPKPVAVAVAAPERRSVERAIDVVGSLKGWEEVTVGAKAAGRVVRVRHDVGDRVRPEEPLVELETRDTDLAIDRAEKLLLAELAKVGVILDAIPAKVPTVDTFDVARLPTVIQAQVAVDRARQNLNREKNLIEKRAGTMQDMQNAENDLKNAEAALSNTILTARSILVSALAAKVSIDVVKQNRDDLEIRAPRPTHPPEGLQTPLSFAVARRSVTEGEMLKVGDKVVDLVVENPLRLWANVPERFSSEVQVGQPVEITVSSRPGKTFPGKVARISPAVEAASRTFQVEAAVPNDAGLLRPGGFAKARIITDRHAEATIVPQDVVVQYAGVTKLFVVDGASKSHAIEVQTGEQGSGWVEILTPLPADSRVVLTGQARLAEGTAVTIRPPEAVAAKTPAAPEAIKTPAEPTTHQ